MSKKNKEVSISGTFDIKNTTGILDKLDLEISQLKAIETTTWKTNGDLEGFGNIKSEKKIENLIRAYSFVLAKSKFYNESALALGVKTFPVFTIGGTLEEWEHDIKLQISIVSHQDKYDKLKKAKDALSKFLSEDEQKMAILKEVAEMFV